MLVGCRLPGRRGPSPPSEWVLQADLGLENPVFSAVGGVEGQAGLGQPVLARAQERLCHRRGVPAVRGKVGRLSWTRRVFWKTRWRYSFDLCDLTLGETGQDMQVNVPGGDEGGFLLWVLSRGVGGSSPRIAGIRGAPGGRSVKILQIRSSGGDRRRRLTAGPGARVGGKVGRSPWAERVFWKHDRIAKRPVRRVSKTGPVLWDISRAVDVPGISGGAELRIRRGIVKNRGVVPPGRCATRS